MKILPFLLLLFLTVNGIFSTEINYFITVDNLRLRENPSDKARIISKINKNTKIEILEKSKKVQNIKGIVAHWVKIKLTAEDKTGFIFGAYLKNSETNSEVDFTKCKTSNKGVKIYLNNSKLLFLKNKADKDDTPEGSGINFNECEYIKELESVFVNVFHYEDSEYRLYNLDTGKYIELWGYPIFSLNKKRFLCMSEDLEAHYQPNGFQIFKVYTNPKKEFEFDFQPEDSRMSAEFGPMNAKWIGNNTIQIIAGNYNKTKTMKLLFKRKNHSWKQVENEKSKP
jgi:hypothetical protein